MVLGILVAMMDKAEDDKVEGSCTVNKNNLAIIEAIVESVVAGARLSTGMITKEQQLGGTPFLLLVIKRLQNLSL